MTSPTYGKARAVLCSSLALAFAFTGFAQTSTTGAASSDASKDLGPTVQLSPFQVSAANDDGYRTRDIVTGTKIATPLNESPLTVGVVTRELLDDIHLDRVTDAIAFTQAGVSNLGRTFQDQELFTFRGYDGTILRNGVKFNAWTDASNIERIEVARGPSAILYGFVAPGGVVNYVTKKPFAGSLNYVKARWGSETGFREEYDFNRSFFDNRLLVRVDGAQNDGSTWIHYQTIHDTVVNPSVTLRLTPTTTLTYDFSYRDRRGPFERIRFYYINKADGFDSVVLAPYLGDNGNAGYSWNPGVAPWTKSEWTRRRSELRLEQTIGEHWRLLAIASDDFSHEEELTTFTNFKGARDIGYQNMLIPPPDHILLSIMPVYENLRSHTQYAEANLLGQYETKWFKSNTLFGVQASRTPSFWPRNGYMAPDPSKIGVIDYTLQSPYTVRLSDPLSKRYYLPAGDPSQWPVWFTQGTVRDWGKPDMFVTESLGALNNRLHALLGVRRQQYPELQVTKTLPQVGAIYEVIRGYSLYGIWSKTSESNGRTLRYNLPRPLSDSKAWDLGMKFDTFDSKISGSIAYFKIHKGNLAITDPRGVIDYAQGKADDTVSFTPGTQSTGVEANLQYQPNRNFQLTVSYAKTNAKILPGDPNPAKVGTQLIQAVPQAFTFFGKYTFRSGALDRLAVGAGMVQNYGPIYVDDPATSGLANEHGYTIVNAFVRYPFKVGGRTFSAEVACNNITDDRPFMNGGFYPPREWYFSIDAKF